MYLVLPALRASSMASIVSSMGLSTAEASVHRSESSLNALTPAYQRDGLAKRRVCSRAA